MAINTYRFWMATDANRLLANQFAFIQAAAPSFYQGNVAQLELHIVASAGVGTSPVEVPFPAGAAISVAVGDTNTYPTGGSWELMVGTTETQPMPYNATTAQVAAALNALSEVTAAGGVSVSKTGEGYTITWNTYGSKPAIGIGSDTLTPSSYESISLVQAGNAEHRQIVFVELRQNPIALSSEWTPLPTPAVTVSEIQAWNGTNRIWRVGISPQPKAGSITISYGTKTATLAYNASPASIASALSPAQVFSTGQYQWDIVIAEDSVLTASGSLIGYNGYSGSINFATAECHQFLAGAERKSTVLEVSISLDDKRYTLLQTPCNVFADVVSDGVITPLPLGVAISEQVANARFVRRDIDQNPDAATQDIIWKNLGVETLGSDVAGALNAADSPSAANPFATISDIPTVTQAEWGNITGDINSQTDLAVILNGLDVQKYDVSNPAGYIDASYLNGYATESWVQSQGYLTNATLNGYAQLSGSEFTGPVTFSGFGSINVGGYDSDGYPVLRFGSGTTPTFVGWGNFYFDGSDFKYGDGQNQPQTIASRLWVNNQGYLTSSALAGYATQSWVTSQGYITSSALTPYAPLSNPSFSGVSRFVNPANYAVVLDDPSTPGYSTSISMQSIFITQNNVENVSIGIGGFKRSSGTQYFGELTSDTVRVVNPSGQISMNYANGIQRDGTELYARKAGDTFTGKVNFTSVGGQAGLNVGIGGTSTNATSNGDLWISTGGTNLNFRDGTGSWRILVNTSNSNSFSAPQIIDTTATTAALRVTQKGTGNAIEVEDNTTPDATRFVVDQFGKVGVGTAPDTTAAIRVDGNGISFNGLTFNPTATAAHTGGTDTLDLLVTINGVNYRLGLRPA